jgi:biopolymer transport protein ExbD
VLFFVDFQDLIEMLRDIYLFGEFHMPLKATYKLGRNRIVFKDKFQMFSNEPMSSGNKLSFKLSGDTIVLDSEIPKKYVLSRYNSLVDHYANSRGLKISLPTSDIPFSEHVSKSEYLEYLDLFIGYDQGGKVQLGVNDIYLESLDELKEWIYTEKDQFHTEFIFRVFADRTLGYQYLSEVRNTLRDCNLRRVKYVTKPAIRRLKNVDDNPYVNRFYGIPMAIPFYRVIVISE